MSSLYINEEENADYQDDVINRERNPASRRRPVYKGPNGQMTPIPWVGGGNPFADRWVQVNTERAQRADRNNLCIVCGLHRGDEWVYALLNGMPSDRRDPLGSIFGGPPAPTYGHPECILIAALYCPHLMGQEYPAMTKDKTTKLSINDLKNLVRQRKTLESENDS